MKMFLTRMGFRSKIVITGDVTQIDLIRQKDSGLLNARRLLEGIEGIAFAELTALGCRPPSDRSEDHRAL